MLEILFTHLDDGINKKNYKNLIFIVFFINFALHFLNGFIAQLVEQRPLKAKVVGSWPTESTNKHTKKEGT